jgi:hypothetical protein
VLRQVQPLKFVFARNTHPYKEIGHFQHRECSPNRQTPGDQYTHELIENLARISVENSQRQGVALSIMENRIDHRKGENSGHQSPQRASGAMNAERVERIVVAK